MTGVLGRGSIGVMRHRPALIAGLTAILITLALGACAKTPKVPAPAGQAFAIIVLGGSWDRLQLG